MIMLLNLHLQVWWEVMEVLAPSAQLLARLFAMLYFYIYLYLSSH